MTSPYSLVITTTNSAGSAREIASDLLHQKLAACVQLVPVESLYTWQDKIETSKEYALHIKTLTGNFEAVRQAVCKNHPYETPEVIRLEIAGGHQPYLDWMQDVTMKATVDKNGDETA